MFVDFTTLNTHLALSTPRDAEHPTLSAGEQVFLGWHERSACTPTHEHTQTHRDLHNTHTHTHRFTPHLASSEHFQLVQSVLTGGKGAAYKLTAVSAESSGQRGLRMYCTHRQKWITEEFTVSNTDHFITPSAAASAGSKVKETNPWIPVHLQVVCPHPFLFHVGKPDKTNTEFWINNDSPQRNYLTILTVSFQINQLKLWVRSCC